MNHSRTPHGWLATVTISLGTLIAGCGGDAAQLEPAGVSADEALVTHCAPQFEPECTTCGPEEGCKPRTRVCWCVPAVSCGEVTPDAVWTANGGNGVFASSTTAYAQTACAGYVVDMVPLSPSVPDGLVVGGWAERDATIDPATTQTACEATVVSTEIWSMTPPTLVTAASTHGKWSSGGCFASTNFQQAMQVRSSSREYRWVARVSEVGTEGVSRPKPVKITTAL
jgi:hypothetical protein